MSAFDDVRDRVNKVTANIASAVKEQYEAKLSNKKNADYVKDLGLDAQEARSILASSSFPRFARYADESIKNMYRQLRDTWLDGDTDSIKQIKRSIQLAAKIELMERMKNRPQELIDEIKQYSKED